MECPGGRQLPTVASRCQSKWPFELHWPTIPLCYCATHTRGCCPPHCSSDCVVAAAVYPTLDQLSSATQWPSRCLCSPRAVHAMSSDTDDALLNTRRRSPPHPRQRSHRTPPKPAPLTDDDDDDAYVTHALQALHTHYTPSVARTIERRKRRTPHRTGKRPSGGSGRLGLTSASGSISTTDQCVDTAARRHRAPVDSSTLSHLPTARLLYPLLFTASTSSTASSYSPTSPTVANPLDRAYTARFRHLSAALLNLLSSLPLRPLPTPLSSAAPSLPPTSATDYESS